MRARAVRMIVSVVAVVCLLMGLPGAFFASVSIWTSEQRSLEVQSQLILQNIERRRAAGEGNDPATLASLVEDQANSRGGELSYRIKVPNSNIATNGKVISGRTMTAVASSPSGVSVQLTASASNALGRIAWTCSLFGGGMALSMLIGWLMARALSRDLSAPLIYLAAQAEQIGSGGVRARVEGRECNITVNFAVEAGQRLHVLLRPEDLRVDEIHHNSDADGLIGYVRERNYKGMTLESVVELENGKMVMVSEFFNEDDPDFDHSLDQKMSINWVESWEVVLADEEHQ